MIYTPQQQMIVARQIARSAQRDIKSAPGMKISFMIYPVENTFSIHEEMLRVIAFALGMNADCYKKKTRMRDVVEMRFIAALLLRIHFPRFTLNQIAMLFGGQDHTSILSGIARAHDLIYTGDRRFTEKYNVAVAAVNKWLMAEASSQELALSA